jgi:hypothetical protein
VSALVLVSIGMWAFGNCEVRPFSFLRKHVEPHFLIGFFYYFEKDCLSGFYGIVMKEVDRCREAACSYYGQLGMEGY